MQIKICLAFVFAFVAAAHAGYEVHHPEPTTTTEIYIEEESSVHTEVEVASGAGEVVEQGNCDNGLGKCVPFYQCKHDDHHGDDGNHHHDGPRGPGKKWGGGWGSHRSQRSPHGGHAGHGGPGWHHGPHGMEDECKGDHECCCKIASIDLTGQPPKHFHQH